MSLSDLERRDTSGPVFPVFPYVRSCRLTDSDQIRHGYPSPTYAYTV